MSDETRPPPGEGHARSAPPGEGHARSAPPGEGHAHAALPGDDVLRRAARALREREGGDPLAGRTTKADVLRALAPPPPPRARPFALAGLAAALAMSTAWAASGRLPELGALLARALGTPPEPTLVPETLPPPAPRAPAPSERNAVADDRAAIDATADDRAVIAGAEGSPRRADKAPAATGAPPRAGDATAATGAPPRADKAPTAPAATPTTAPEAPAPKRDDRPAPPPKRGQAPPPAAGVGASKPEGNVAPTPPPTATTTTSPPPAASPSADELYEQAHRAHFSGRDMAAALAAWDRYLAAAPRGRFALEARYNRALALNRLGRRDEAARALEPFAAGDFGAYRQAEARRLLESLRGAPPLPPVARTQRRGGRPALTPRGARARVSAGAAGPAPSGRGR
jgi:hypothetical protein